MSYKTGGKDASPEVMKDRNVRKVPVPIHYPFWFGGSASCFAACITHPLDLVKVRLQTQGHEGPKRNMLQMFGHVARKDGVPGLYRGISASILRQLTYSTVRFGVYEELKQNLATKKDKKIPFFTLVWMSSFAGFLGGVAGNPADLLNVRMQHDAALPKEQRRNYKHVFDGLIRMSREEGVASLWKGVWPNSIRAALMTAGQLASYDVFKGLLLKHTSAKDNLTTHFTASFAAGFVATTICSPVDVIKTRVMSATVHEGIFTLLKNIYQKEGLTWMFRGWVPSFIRIGPHTVFTFVFLEQQKKAYRYFKGLDT